MSNRPHARSQHAPAYPDGVLPRLRYRYCPMCATPLTRAIVNDDGIERVICPNCEWAHYPANALGVNVVITTGDGIVAIFPPGETGDAGVALPGGHVEYGESPEEAAVREAYEETGLKVECVRCLDWYFERNTDYPGPIVSFIYEAHAVGGVLKGSEEGDPQICTLSAFPPISPRRRGSQKALHAYLASVRELRVAGPFTPESHQ